MLLSSHVRVSEWIHRVNPQPECQANLCSEQVQYMKFLSDSSGIQTHNQLVHKRHSTIGCVLVYELIDCVFESRYCH